MNEESKRMPKILRFAVSGALVLAPAVVGCGGGSAEGNETVHANEPMQEEAPVEETPVEEEVETVNEPAPEDSYEE